MEKKKGCKISRKNFKSKKGHIRQRILLTGLEEESILSLTSWKVARRCTIVSVADLVCSMLTVYPRFTDNFHIDTETKWIQFNNKMNLIGLWNKSSLPQKYNEALSFPSSRRGNPNFRNNSNAFRRWVVKFYRNPEKIRIKDEVVSVNFSWK